MKLRTATTLAAMLALLFSRRAFAADPDKDELAYARFLDTEGARAFSEHRYRDAIRLFEAAFAHGAPPSELWNVAKCHMQLDEPKHARDALERYRSHPDVSTADRARASEEIARLEAKKSRVIVDTDPRPARVVIDGGSAGMGTSPYAAFVEPGPHTIRVTHPDHDPVERPIVASLGQAAIVMIRFDEDSSALEPDSMARGHAPKRLTLRATAGPSFARLGDVGQPVLAAGALGARVNLIDKERMIFGLGVRGAWETVSFGGASPSPAAGCTPPASGVAHSLGALATAEAGMRLTARLRLESALGWGVMATLPREVGGDVFQPSCDPNFGASWAFLFAPSLSFAFAPSLRLVLTPAELFIRPAPSGAQTAPEDASGMWLRLSTQLGLAWDLL